MKRALPNPMFKVLNLVAIDTGKLTGNDGGTNGWSKPEATQNSGDSSHKWYVLLKKELKENQQTGFPLPPILLGYSAHLVL